MSFLIKLLKLKINYYPITKFNDNNIFSNFFKYCLIEKLECIVFLINKKELYNCRILNYETFLKFNDIKFEF